VVRRPLPTQALEPVELETWLTQRDLSQADRATLSRVVRRFEEELRRGRWAADSQPLNEPQRRRLEENLSVVLETWFHNKVNRYFDQPPEERAKWLDRQIKDLEQAFHRGGKGGRGRMPSMGGSLQLLGMIGGRMEQWVQRADPDTQVRMREFQRAVQQRLFSRSGAGKSA
jgi:hypothetical protein